MISNICYAIVFLIESLISFYYFDFKFKRRISKKFIPISILLSGLVLYIINLIEIPLINAVCFYVCNFIILRICYNSSIKSGIFANFVLLFLMIITELIVILPFSVVSRFSLFESRSDAFILIIQAIMSKLLYFLSIHLIIKISQKESIETNSKFSLILCILPIASIILMHTTVYLCIIYSVNDNFKLSLVIGNLLLLFSNIIVFYINELTIKVNQKYTQILLDKQQEKDTIDYYKLLSEQNENSKVLIHDITKHLNTIKQLSEDKDSNIAQYISEIVNDFSIMNPIDYCNNPTVNLITHRYYEICKKNNINFTISIKNANIDFIKGHDITALLDNLLENAVESALMTNEKFIDFSISTRNSNFVIIKISNSCNKKPKYINGTLVSSKITSGMHGIGTRSIKRVVAKYNGNLEMKFDSNTNTFTSTIGINSNIQNSNQT
ncbi:sensor histidine kinase [Ruminococcus sp.]|uniref:sensor histidine kinase n=1 Tax=Ruminococcus sp. TaxID=41978 RepID=UPI004025B47D